MTEPSAAIALPTTTQSPAEDASIAYQVASAQSSTLARGPMINHAEVENEAVPTLHEFPNEQNPAATADSSLPTLDPAQKRLNALRRRQASLTTTLTTLHHQRTALLLSLSQHLPAHTTGPLDLDIPTSPQPYTPSTHSHTTPSLPEISDEDRDNLLKEAKKVVRQHIELLHTYNEIKDVGQGLIGIIAEQRGSRVVDCQEEFGVGAGD